MDTSAFREKAGVIVAAVIIIAFIAVGFVQVAASWFTGRPISVPGDWMAAMLSLASAALGFLIGKQSSQPGPGEVAHVQEAIATNAAQKAAEAVSANLTK